MESILITGGTGSFGQAFTSDLLAKFPGIRICIYSRGEHAQAAMRRQLGDDARLRWLIGDVRDKDRLSRAMRGVDTVVHAAALKRIEVGNYCPDEMVKTNVLGAMNLIEAALENKIERVVALSTDKACQPISPYGQSKALAESLFLAANTMHGKHGPKFAVTRYGNVWWSAGSVGPHWASLVKAGQRQLPVTDVECTRFFMRMREAVALVRNTLEFMQGGELVIPTWLPAYRLGDLVEAFGCEPVEAELPPWEKLHESMREGCSSDRATRMTIAQLRAEIDEKSIRERS